MRIADKYLQELIQHDGQLSSGPVEKLAVLRLALDLREARETAAQLESSLQLRIEAEEKRKPATAPRRLHVVEEISARKKVDSRA